MGNNKKYIVLPGIKYGKNNCYISAINVINAYGVNSKECLIITSTEDLKKLNGFCPEKKLILLEPKVNNVYNLKRAKLIKLTNTYIKARIQNYEYFRSLIAISRHKQQIKKEIMKR